MPLLVRLLSQGYQTEKLLIVYPPPPLNLTPSPPPPLFFPFFYFYFYFTSDHYYCYYSEHPSYRGQNNRHVDCGPINTRRRNSVRLYCHWLHGNRYVSRSAFLSFCLCVSVSGILSVILRVYVRLLIRISFSLIVSKCVYRATSCCLFRDTFWLRASKNAFKDGSLYFANSLSPPSIVMKVRTGIKSSQET